MTNLTEPKVREATIEDHIIADCPGCLDPMLLGDIWRELIVEDGDDVPKCPDCEPEEWTDTAEPKIDAIEVWALSGDLIELDGGKHE